MTADKYTVSTCRQCVEYNLARDLSTIFYTGKGVCGPVKFFGQVIYFRYMGSERVFLGQQNNVCISILFTPFMLCVHACTYECTTHISRHS